jgi:hypothetical protein
VSRSVQNVHDVVIRHHIALNNGYEMNTQGDSFELAFRNVQSATRFCLAVQLDLLHAKWSKNVLLLPSCGVVKNSTGKLVFAGPRVRMGIHLATKGTFAMFWHDLTKQVQFNGVCHSPTPSYHASNVPTQRPYPTTLPNVSPPYPTSLPTVPTQRPYPTSLPNVPILICTRRWWQGRR